MSLLKYLNSTICCDAPLHYQNGFQDPATPVFEGTIFLHDLIWVFLIFIVFFVSWMLFRIVILFKENAGTRVISTTQNIPLESIWTITPAFILTLIAGNSISHLYTSEEALTPAIDVIITGNQWFWSYEILVFDKKITFESHIVPDEDLKIGELRGLEVDNPLILPVETTIRIIVNANDVIHSWAVPSLGVKIDAVPGRTNTGTIFAKREGRFYGQCSEICGKGHGYMPIVVIATNKEQYQAYLHYLYLNSLESNIYKHFINSEYSFSLIKTTIF